MSFTIGYHLYEQGAETIWLHGYNQISIALMDLLVENCRPVKLIKLTTGNQKIWTVSGSSRYTINFQEAINQIFKKQSNDVFVIVDKINNEELTQIQKVLPKNRIFSLQGCLMSAIWRNGLYIPLTDLCRNLNINVSVFRLRNISIDDIPENQRSEYERMLISHSAGKLSKEQFQEMMHIRRSEVLNKYTDDEIDECSREWAKMYLYNGICYLQDERSKYRNVAESERLTTDVPQNCVHNIYFFGNSICYGYLSNDSDTIQSCLQRILNSSAYSGKYAVHNYPRGGAFSLKSFFRF